MGFPASAVANALVSAAGALDVATSILLGETPSSSASNSGSLSSRDPTPAAGVWGKVGSSNSNKHANAGIVHQMSSNTNSGNHHARSGNSSGPMGVAAPSATTLLQRGAQTREVSNGGGAGPSVPIMTRAEAAEAKHRKFMSACLCLVFVCICLYLSVCVYLCFDTSPCFYVSLYIPHTHSHAHSLPLTPPPLLQVHSRSPVARTSRITTSACVSTTTVRQTGGETRTTCATPPVSVQTTRNTQTARMATAVCARTTCWRECFTQTYLR